MIRTVGVAALLALSACASAPKEDAPGGPPDVRLTEGLQADAIGPWSAAQGSEYAADGLTWRFSKKLIKDSYGVDGCSKDAAGEYRCVVILNTGAFIEVLDYKVPRN